jgi:hypothetical protein
MSGKKVRLSLTSTRAVCSEADLDRPPQVRSLVLTAVTFLKAVALAETAKTRFRAPRHQFLPSQTLAFARALREAMAEPVAVGGRRTSSRFTPLGQLREFFEQPEQKRALSRLISFVEGGGTLDVPDA